MKRVNLDAEFEIFKEKFCELHGLEDAWQRHQQEEGLIDISNSPCDHKLGDKFLFDEEGMCTYCNTRWVVLFDTGKPYEIHYANDEELAVGLRDFYWAHKDSDYTYDVKVYNARGDDFTETQFINEMIEEILGDENDN